MSAAPIDFAALARKSAKKSKAAAAPSATAAATDTAADAVDDMVAKMMRSTSPRRGGAKTKYGRAADLVTLEEEPVSAPHAGAGLAPAPAPAPAAEPELKPSSMRQSLLYSFANMMAQFLAAAATVWPKDVAIAKWNDAFGATVSAADDKGREAFFGTLIAGFHESFKEHYSNIASRNAALFDDERNPWLVAVRAKAKLREASPQIRANVWEYASFLARMSNMYALYAKCPDSLLGHIHKLALRLGGQLQRGELAMGDLNPIMLGQQLMGVMSRDEVSKLGSSILSESNVDGILSLLQSMVGMLGGTAMGGMDLESMISAATAATGAGAGVAAAAGAGVAGAGVAAAAGAGGAST